jgi:hypothetical protein
MSDVHRPDWTDHNAPDPGFTLLQLFAFTAVGLATGFAVQRWRRRRSLPGG